MLPNVLHTIKGKAENVENYVLACLRSHNYLRLRDNASHCPNGFRYSNKAIKTRNAIEDFVNSEEGSVIWQEEYVARTSYDREDTTNEQELIISAC